MPHPRPHFAIILQPATADEQVVLQAAPDPNRATLVLHQERARLLQAGVVGELRVIRVNGETRTLLRERLRLERRHQGRSPVGEDAAGPGRSLPRRLRNCTSSATISQTPRSLPSSS